MKVTDLQRLAAILIRKYGDDAEAYAQLRAGEAMARRDMPRRDAWNRLAREVSAAEGQLSGGHAFH
jgi:hypothetical protein